MILFPLNFFSDEANPIISCGLAKIAWARSQGSCLEKDALRSVKTTKRHQMYKLLPVPICGSRLIGKNDDERQLGVIFSCVDDYLMSFFELMTVFYLLSLSICL